MKQLPLEESIRKESEEAVRAIREQEALEIKELDEACAAEIAEFRDKTEAEGRAKIEQGLSRLENKGILERKKLNLCGLDNFMRRMVKEAVKLIRTDSRYKAFLLDSVHDAVGEIRAGIEVSLQKEDLVFEKGSWKLRGERDGTPTLSYTKIPRSSGAGAPYATRRTDVSSTAPSRGSTTGNLRRSAGRS